MLVKGRVVKVVDKTTHRDDHDPDTLVERFRDRYVTTVATLSAAITAWRSSRTPSA
jgi:exoribonuclease II